MSEVNNAASAAPVDSSAESQESTESQETSGEGLEALDANGNPVTPKAKEEVKKAIEKKLKKLKLKVDGKDIEESFDVDDDEYLTRQLQMAKMGQKRAQEKADLEREITAFFQEFKKNPRKILETADLGIDMKSLVEDYINEQLENAKKSPQQLEKEKIEGELKRLKEEREREKQDYKAKELERLQQVEFERYDMQMSKALESSDLPKSPYIIKKMADYMLLGLQNGHDVSPEDVLPLVREEMHSDLQEMFAVMPEDVIEKVLGEGVINKLRKRRVAKAQSVQTGAVTKGNVQDTGANVKKGEEKAKEKKSFKDFFGV